MNLALAPARSRIFAIRALYFIFFCAFGTYTAYINIYLRTLGFSGADIGWVNTIAPLIGMLAAPFWGTLNDRIRSPRLLMAISSVGAAVSLTFFSQVKSFELIVAAAAAYTFFVSTFIPLLDSLNLAILGSNRAQYGRQRMWGSAGYIVATTTFGFLIQNVSWMFVFIGAIAALLLLLPVLWLVRFPTPAGTRKQGNSPYQLIRQKGWLLFAACLLLIGVANNSLNHFLGVYVKDMGGGEQLVGTAASLGVITELPVMFFSGYLLKRFGSRSMLGISFAVFSLRFLVYSILPSPEWIIPVALMHGFSFGFYWVGSVTTSNELAPAELKSTSQGLMMGVINLANVTGSFINGQLYDAVGPSRLFFIVSLMAFAAFLIVLIWKGLAKPASPQKE